MWAVARLGVALQLHAVELGAAEHALLLLDGERLEGGEVVHPAHDQHVAAAGAGLAVGDEGRGGRLVGHRVGGAVDEAGQVAAVAVDEAVLVGGDRSRRRSSSLTAARACSNTTSRELTADPEPEVVLGGGRMVAAGPADRLERRQVGRRMLRAQSRATGPRRSR